MDFMSMLGTMGAMSGPSNGDAKNNGKMQMLLYQNDAKDFVKWGAIGFLGMGIYQLGIRVAKRNINPCVELKDRADSLNLDPIIRDSFINMQSYRELNPWMFKTSIQNVDHLLFLENVLLNKTVHPTRNDKVIAFSYFRMSLIRLNMFQLLVKEKLGNDHAMAVNIFVKKIYTQIQKHFLNVLHICSEFKPGNLVARASEEVKSAMQAYNEGVKYKSNTKWEGYKKLKKNKKRHR